MSAISLSELFDSIRLVFLHADVAFLQAEMLHDSHGTFDDVFRVLQHQSVVRCNKRLTFCSVDDQRVHFLQILRIQLDVSRERSSAQTNNDRWLLLLQ